MKKSTLLLLSFLAFTLIALFCSLGFWQLKRAQFKEQLQLTFLQRQNLPPVQHLNDGDLSLSFRQGQLKGTWLINHWILLDNKIHQKKLGFEVYALFQPEHYHGLLLVNLGFTPLLKNRHTTPLLPKLPPETTIIHGFFSEPPRYFALGSMTEKKFHQQPLIVQYINLAELEKTLLLGKINQNVLILNAGQAGSLPQSWVPPTKSPEKNRGYALQWFAMAVTLLLLFLTLFFKHIRRNRT